MNGCMTAGISWVSPATDGGFHMVRTLLIRGMIVGFLAGILVFGFAKYFGEPQVDVAIAFESAADEAKMKAEMAKGMHVEEEPELVSRSNQASWGLLTGVMTYATAFGGLFALVFAACYGRMCQLGPRATSALLALAGFACLYIVPNLKYPANPPAIGNPDTIGIRTALYFSMMLLSVIAMVAAATLRNRLVPKYGQWSAALISAAVYVVAVIAVAAFLPPINEVPDGFPATTLWRFRIDSLGMQAIMWATFGLGFGWLTERDTVARLYHAPANASTAWR
jgi:predicted cobalt transporter CbtA